MSTEVESESSLSMAQEASPDLEEAQPDMLPENMDFTTSPLFLDSDSSDMVIVHLGVSPSMLSLLVHRHIVSEKSSILSLLLNPEESQPPEELHLPDDDPQLFIYLLNYIYTNAVLPSLTPSIVTTKSLTPATATHTPSPSINGPTKDHLIKTFKSLSTNPTYTPFHRPFTATIPTRSALWQHRIVTDIDFSTMQSKLVQGIYRDLRSIDRDFDLIYNNQLSFHGSKHQYTDLADSFRALYREKTAELRPKGSEGDGGRGVLKMPKTHLQQQFERMAELAVGLPVEVLLGLEVLATKYHIPTLQDLILTSILSSHLTSSTFLTLPQINTYYPLSTPNSPLRKYILKTISFHLFSKTALPTDTIGDLNRTENLYQLIATNEELGMEVFGMLRGRGGIAFGDPRKGGFCEFHCHGRDGVCGLGGEVWRGVGRKRAAVEMEGWF
ncbi:uncharacterized protein LY89DRAFT_734034 [Mollisia scopiformis]|uniref:BTB domain-containing protein n=1 Tax=Mollisia scopiformis TaxID=149040 RepID=A0A194XBA5_MOLSC|nr:uncharacterized protein LY89DRAFT_734034 [Mollisia scopiformis]KUJ17042.1 hypothetical protein LY89DRAFT_734034 [Mollisia scopiformis]